MRTHHLLILSLLMMFGACKKSTNPSDESQVIRKIEPVIKSSFYRSNNSGEALVLSSDNTCEYSTGGRTFAGTYSKQGDSIRVVCKISGSDQILHYKLSDGNLQSADGGKLFSADSQSKINMMNISVAIGGYLNDNNSLPRAIGDLIPKYLKNSDLFMDPHNPGSDEIAYDYTWCEMADDPHRVILRSHFKNQDGKNLVLTLVCEVKWE